jgi:hypothetical protein
LSRSTRLEAGECGLRQQGGSNLQGWEARKLKGTLLSILVLVVILAASAVVTNWFARAMYNRCASCGTLNAKRRTHCRSCGVEVR